MADFSYTPNATTAPIRNPYSSSSSSSINYKSSSLLVPSSTRKSMAPMASTGVAASSDTETMMRDLIRSTEHSAGVIPSLSSIETLLEQLRIQRDIKWSAEFAQGVGHTVVNCIRYCTLIDQSNGENDNSKTGTINPEKVAIAALGLLATVMEDWEDHVLYAVLVQDESNYHINSYSNSVIGNHHHKTEKSIQNLVGEHLLNMLTRLCVPLDNNNHYFKKDDCETIHRKATICLATAWRCLDRLEQFTTLTNITNSGVSCGREHTRSPWWISDERTMNSLAVVSFQSLFLICGCSNNPSYDDFDSHQRQRELREQQMAAGPDVDQEQQKMSSLTILAILLRYQLLDLSVSSVSNTISRSNADDGCILPEGTLVELISKLIKGIQILNHSILPPSSSEYALPIAMLSMSILSLLQKSLKSSENASLFHGLDQTIQSTGLVDNIVQFTFFSTVYPGGNGAQAPRWISTASKRFQKGYLQSFGLLLFSCWNFCDSAAWRVVVANLEPKLKSIIDPFWSNLSQTGNIQHRNLLSDNDKHLEGQLTGILWLYINIRSHARCRLNYVLETTLADPVGVTNVPSSQCNSMSTTNCAISKVRALSNMVHTLFGILRLSSSASYSARLMTSRLLRILLTDRRIVSSNDELSRTIWLAVDQSVVESHLETVLEHADTDDGSQPLLLTLVDTMETLLEYEEKRNYLVDKLAAHNLETLIYLIKPKDVRYDFTLGIDEEVADIDTQTPPLHNLSRMDETSICIEHEETKDPRGLDHSVRLSVATSLARLAYGSSKAPLNESIGLLISRVSSAVNDFLVEYHNIIERGENGNDETKNATIFTPSMDQTKRFLRLQHACTTPENEEFLSSMMFTGISLRKKKISQLIDAQRETEHNFQMTLQREKKTQEERTRLIQQLRVQSIIFQRELSRTKLNTTQDARQLVSMHASERSSAEERSNALQQRAEREKLELERVKSEAQVTINELHMTRSKVDELNGTIGTLQQELQIEKAKANEIVQEIETNRDAIRSFEEKCDVMQNAIDEKKDGISRMEDTNHRLQSNLEDLFADMCSLAQICQHKEAQEESQKQNNTAVIEAMNQKLTVERRQNEELGSKMKDVQDENDKLYRKLAKYKERLEQERNERRDEQNKRKEEEHRRKRSGPVSYLNSLHTSTASDMNQSRSNSTRSLQGQTASSQRARSERPPSQHQSRGRSRHEKENSRYNQNHRSSSRSQRKLDY